jgi:hypothetical protein
MDLAYEMVDRVLVRLGDSDDIRTAGVFYSMEEIGVAESLRSTHGEDIVKEYDLAQNKTKVCPLGE